MKTLVDEALFAPGSCAVCLGSKGPFVDMGVDANALDRMYLCLRCVGEAAFLAGGGTAQDMGAMREGFALQEARIEELEAELTKMREVVEQAELLREAIAFTLENGVVVDGRGKKVKLRPGPGMRGYDARKPLLEAEAEDGAGVA